MFNAFQWNCFNLVDTCNIALILFLKCDVTKFRFPPPLSYNVTLRRPPPPLNVWPNLWMASKCDNKMIPEAVDRSPGIFLTAEGNLSYEIVWWRGCKTIHLHKLRTLSPNEVSRVTQHVGKGEGRGREDYILLQCLRTSAILAGAHSYFVVLSFKSEGIHSCYELIPNPRS